MDSPRRRQHHRRKTRSVPYTTTPISLTEQDGTEDLDDLPSSSSSSSSGDDEHPVTSIHREDVATSPITGKSRKRRRQRRELRDIERARKRMAKMSLRQSKSEETLDKSSDTKRDASTNTVNEALRPCVVCLDPAKESCVVFLPCFHCQTCRNCAIRINKLKLPCPTCRQPVFSMRRVFF